MRNSRNVIALFIGLLVMVALSGCDIDRILGSSRDYLYGSPVVMENASTGSLIYPGKIYWDKAEFLFRAAYTDDKCEDEKVVGVFYQYDGGREFGVPFRGDGHQDYIRLTNPGAGEFSLKLRIETQVPLDDREVQPYTYTVRYTIKWHVPDA